MTTEEIIKPVETEQTDRLDDTTEDISDDKPENNNDDTDETDEPSDKKGLEKSETGNEDIYGSPDTFDYSEIKLPEGMTLDNDLLGEFEPIARELNLSNTSANKLMNLAVKLSSKNMANITDALNQAQIAEKNSYMDMLDKDPELNANDTAQYDKYLDVANLGYNAVATKGFKDFVDSKGLTHHPEFIKVFHNIGKLCKEASLPDVKTPAGKKLDAAEVLYGNRDVE